MIIYQFIYYQFIKDITILNCYTSYNIASKIYKPKPDITKGSADKSTTLVRYLNIPFSVTPRKRSKKSVRSYEKHS